MPLSSRADAGVQPCWLTAARPSEGPVDILFWSGGKDSYLAYRALMRKAERQAALLTTFDGKTRVIAHQEVSIREAVAQAEALNAPLLGVPLFAGLDYTDRVGRALELVPCARRLVFGDLRLEHVRSWRESEFGALLESREIELYFPLWERPYAELMEDLERSGVECVVSAVADAASGVVRVGEVFSRAMMERLPSRIDPFGEEGEFHTLARISEPPKE